MPMRKKGDPMYMRVRVGWASCMTKPCELDGCMLAPQCARDDGEKEEKENEKDAETIREKPNPRTQGEGEVDKIDIKEAEVWGGRRDTGCRQMRKKTGKGSMQRRVQEPR